MKSFVYTINVKSRSRSSGTETKVCHLYRVVRNRLRFVGNYTYTFESDEQAALSTAYQHKALRGREILRDSNGSPKVSTYCYKDAGIAVFEGI